MEIEIKATEKIDRLKENLEKRVEKARIEGGQLVVEADETDFLEKTPGVKNFKANGERKEGIGGKPVQEEAYARIESREDAVKALLATIEGYDLRILNTERKWDLKNLKKYNPDIKHLRFEVPQKFLGIEKSLKGAGETEKIEIEIPEDQAETIYREMLT